MKIEKLCQHRVATVHASDELTTAAALMRDQHVGYVVVVDEHEGAARPIGVLTDRDIVVCVVAHKTDPALLRVGDVMTLRPLLAKESDSLGDAIASMRRIGVRRLPVVGARGQLVGVLSLDDILRSMAHKLTDMAGAIRREQRVESELRV